MQNDVKNTKNAILQYLFAAKRSVLAGVLIALGGVGYLSCSSTEVGAFIFTCGLIAVIVFECSLYTGKVGYAAKFKDIPYLLLMCVKNIIGAAAIGFLAMNWLHEKAAAVAAKKLSAALPTFFIKSILCGFMIYIAVELYKKSKNMLTVVLPIMLFILAGFEHCIANAFYFAAAGECSLKMVLYMAVCICGNAIGSILLHFLRHGKLGIIPA